MQRFTVIPAINPATPSTATSPRHHATQKNTTNDSILTTKTPPHHLHTTYLTDQIESAFANRDMEQLLSFMHENNVSSNYPRAGSGNTPLILAVRQGDEEAVIHLLSHPLNASPNLANAKGRTPLMCAAASGHEHIVTLLLTEMSPGQERVHMLFQHDQSGKTALDWARIGRRNRCIHTIQLAIARSIEYIRMERKNAQQREELRLLVEENRTRRIFIQHAILNRDTESIQDLARPLDHAHLTWDSSNKVLNLDTLRRGDFDDQKKKNTKSTEPVQGEGTNDDSNDSNEAFEADRPNIGKGIIVGIANRAALENAVDQMMTDGDRIVNAAPPRSTETGEIVLFADPKRHTLFADHECMGGITPLMYAAGNDIPDLITLLVRRAGADINLKR